MNQRKKRAAKLYYNLTGIYSRLFGSKKRFMNLGFDSENELKLLTDDENDRSNLQLYHKVLQENDINAKNVLEVSCGRGGGCYYFAKYHQPNSVLGIDLSKQNIELCNSLHSFPNLKFQEADAQNFDLKEQKFDIVVNLEASHAYADKKTFYENVFKALKPAGLFLYTDIFKTHQIEQMEVLLKELGFVMEKKENISAGVILSIENNSKKWFPFTYRFPMLIPQKIKNIQGGTGSNLYKKLKSGEFIYCSYVFRKN